MNKTKVQFNYSWLDRTDSLGFKISKWASKSSDSEIFCKVCVNTIKIDKKGFQAIVQHVSTKIHKSNCSLKLGSNQLHLSSLPVSEFESNVSTKTLILDTFCAKDLSTKAELIWSMKTVLFNSAASCNDLFDVFKAMFGDGVPSCFSLGRTKLSYIITEALGPYLRNILLEECNKVYYTLIYDETTNVEGKKELQIALRYWSDQENEIVTCHLETFFIQSATGEKLEEYIMQSLHNSNMSHLKMLMLGSDGPKCQ